MQKIVSNHSFIDLWIYLEQVITLYFIFKSTLKGYRNLKNKIAMASSNFQFDFKFTNQIL